MAYIVPTANSTATQLLASNDTFYLADGLRITNVVAAVAAATATSRDISVILDGAVSNSTANTGAINLLGTDNGLSNGFSNSRVMVGQTGSVASVLGDGIRMVGSSTTVDNAGSISARQVGVILFGGFADVTNTGSIYGQTNAIKVTGDGGVITNSGSLRATTAAVSYTGLTGLVANAGQIDSNDDGIIVSGNGGFVANNGTITTLGAGVTILGGSARIANTGMVQSQGIGLDAGGNSGQIANDGTVFARAEGLRLIGSNGLIRNTGLVSAFDAIALTGDDASIQNSGEVSATSSAIETTGTNIVVQNAATGVMTTSSQGSTTVSASVTGTYTLRNAGIIEGNAVACVVTEPAVADQTVASITNSGTITGGQRAMLFGVDTANIVNRGTIAGGISAIENLLALSAMTILNEGTLRVDAVGGGVAIQGNTGVETLRNTGTVVGDVVLNDGADRVTNDGLVRGLVDLGAGADAYAGLLGRATGAVLGNAGNDSLTGGASADVLDGGTENDQLTGNAGNDSLLGRAGNDTISGGDGNDRITAGVGTDVLAGGAGADVFEFTSAATLGIGVGRDQMTDFVAGTDDIVVLFMASFIGNAAFTAAGQVRYVQATGLLTGSTDADAAAEWALLLVNRPVLTAADFVF